MTHTCSVGESTQDPKSAFLREQRTPQGQLDLTASWMQLVPTPKLTAGQDGSEDCNSQHGSGVEDWLMWTGWAFIGIGDRR